MQHSDLCLLHARGDRGKCRRQWRQTWRLGLRPLPFYHKDKPLLQCDGMLLCSLQHQGKSDVSLG